MDHLSDSILTVLGLEKSFYSCTHLIPWRTVSERGLLQKALGHSTMDSFHPSTVLFATKSDISVYFHERTAFHPSFYKTKARAANRTRLSLPKIPFYRFDANPSSLESLKTLLLVFERIENKWHISLAVDIRTCALRGPMLPSSMKTAPSSVCRFYSWDYEGSGGA